MDVDFEAILSSRFRARAAAAVDVVMCLVADDAAGAPARLATFAVSDGELRFDATLRADVTFAFDSAATAVAIFEGGEDPVTAFMAGRFRADGHLPLAFTLLSLFRPGYGVKTPP